VVLTVVLPGDDAEAVLAAVDGAAGALWSPEEDASAGAGGGKDERASAEAVPGEGAGASAGARPRRADFTDPVAMDGCVPEHERRGEALVALCCAYLAGNTELSVPSGDTTLYLHVDAEVLTEAATHHGPAEPAAGDGERDRDGPPDLPGAQEPPARSEPTVKREPGELRPPLLITERGFSVPRGALAALACDCRLQGVLHQDGRPLALGRRVRRASAAQRRALEGRDRTCTVPGCTRRAYLDARHVRAWSAGGSTELDNLTLLCRRHHRCVHRGLLSIERGADGGLRFFKADGRELTSEPPRPRGPGLAQRTTALGVRVDADTTTPAWDGTRVEMWRCVAALVDADAGRPTLVELGPP
jgi:hypothetical protein